MPSNDARGPLAGLRILEMAAIGPVPFAVMLLADLGAEVVRIERAGAEWPDIPIINRGRTSVTLNLKQTEDRDSAIRLAQKADVIVEGFRPGVMERLGLGPDVLMGGNRRLIYGRMTGWGQDGPLAQYSGHDINFIGLTGMLDMLKHRGTPRAPQNLLGDYACGALYLTLGILAALHERQSSDIGQVVDAAIVDGSVSMLAPILGMVAAGVLPEDPSVGMLAGDAAYYRTYRCADDRFVAVGALESRFRQLLAERLGLDASLFTGGAAGADLESIFLRRPRDEWVEIFADTDCCLSPVLGLAEAEANAHLSARCCFIRVDGVLHPAPAPRFSRTPAALPIETLPHQRLRDWDVEPTGAFA